MFVSPHLSMSAQLADDLNQAKSISSMYNIKIEDKRPNGLNGRLNWVTECQRDVSLLLTPCSHRYLISSKINVGIECTMYVLFKHKKPQQCKKVTYLSLAISGYSVLFIYSDLWIDICKVLPTFEQL